MSSGRKEETPPPPPPQLPPPQPGEAPMPRTDPAAFLATPLRQLHSRNDAGLLTGFDVHANRAPDPRRRSPVLPVQTYVMQNNSALFDRGENTVFIALSDGRALPAFKTRLERDGSMIGYVITEAATGRELVKVHDHGDTKSAVQRAFRGVFRSPAHKWDVENSGLFGDMARGDALGLIRDVFPDHRVFEPMRGSAISRLEMQAVATGGSRYLLAVTDVAEPVGRVDSALVGRFAYRSERYGMAVRGCTREEAVIWLCMVVATDMKRRRVQTAQAGRTPIYGPNLFDPF